MAKSTLRQELNTIRKQLDLSKVAKKAAKNYKWSKAKAAYAVEQYVRHWYICLTFRGRAVAAISFAGDLLWHQHIIDTDKYAADCQALLGRFLSHVPIYGKPNAKEKAAYEDTKALYMQVYGEVPKDIRFTSGNYSYTTNA